MTLKLIQFKKFTMEVDSPNEVETVESGNEENSQLLSNPPIMRLFKRLTTNDQEQNTMLTNAQLIEVLQVEFGMNITQLHELEVDIYLSVIKKFLIHWPQWDDFDKKVNELKQLKKMDELEKILQEKYFKMKEYLRVMLDIAKEKSRDVIKSLEEKDNDVFAVDSKEGEGKKSQKEVMMEVFCSRSQLNELILRRPALEPNKNIFNINGAIPKTIRVVNYDINTIFRYWNVKISINTKSLDFVYNFQQNLKHCLINKMHSNHAYDKIELNNNLQKRNEKKNIKTVPVEFILQSLKNLSKSFTNWKHFLNVLCAVVEMDFKGHDSFEVPGRYRRFLARYPHVRYLYVDNEIDDVKYDLQLEEIIIPTISYTFNHVDTAEKTSSNQKVVVTFECNSCPGSKTSIEDIVSHFNEYHHSEKEWMCTNCNRKLEVFEIGAKGWFHEC